MQENQKIVKLIILNVNLKSGGLKMRRIFGLVSVCIFMIFFIGNNALAIDYPKKPITIIVPFGAGGMSNISTRMIGEQMKSILGQPIIYLNKPGASGIIGLREVERAKPDGYTLASGALTSAFTAPVFLNQKKFDASNFSYVGSYMPQERVLFTGMDKPYKTWEEFIEYSKANPGQVSVGSGAAQWALEVMKAVGKKEQIKWKYVMFGGGGEASSAVLGGHVDVVEAGTGTPAYQAAREGKLRVLINLGSEKVPFFPDVKSVRDYGYEFSTVLEYGMVMPKGVPEPVRKKIEDTLKTVMEDKKLIEMMSETGFSPRFLSGEKYKGVVKNLITQVPELHEYVKGGIE
jgi:tripartite-type tricarboxylate transporter receptor subunit TctC